MTYPRAYHRAEMENKNKGTPTKMVKNDEVTKYQFKIKFFALMMDELKLDGVNTFLT